MIMLLVVLDIGDIPILPIYEMPVTKRRHKKIPENFSVGWGFFCVLGGGGGLVVFLLLLLLILFFVFLCKRQYFYEGQGDTSVLKNELLK